MYPEDFDNMIIKSRSHFEQLDRKTQVGICIHQLEAQVNNGGFDQFFFNSSGEYTLETITALETIGASATVTLLRKALEIAYPKGFPQDATLHQQEQVDSDEAMDKLELLDEAFLAYEDDLAALTNDYIAKDT